MAQIFKSGDLSNLIRSFDSISGGFLSNYFNARYNIFEGPNSFIALFTIFTPNTQTQQAL